MSLSFRVPALLLTLFLVAATAAAQADLFIGKTGPASANPGDNITFTVTIGNNGPSDAASAVMTDTLPSGGTFVSETQTSGPTFTCSTPNVGDPGGTVSCTNATFTNGSGATFNIVVNVSAGAAGTTLINSATISSDTPDNNPENNSSTAGTAISGGTLADVAVSKSGPQFAAPSSSVTFTITVTDLGPNDASSVTLNDTLGAGLTFVSLTQTSGPTFSCPGNNTPCTIATLPNGSTATFDLVATTSATPGTYTNTASVTSANDPNPENDSASASVNVSSADVGVVKSGPATAQAGTQFDYTITVSNGGPDAAVNAGFSDTLPAGLTFVAVAQTGGFAGASCNTDVTQTTVACSNPALPNGQSMTFDLTVKLASSAATGSMITNTATTTSGSADTNGNNNSSNAAVTVTTNADLMIAKNGPASVTAGTTATYTITVTNNGPSDATSVQWVDTLPPNTTFASEMQNSGPTFNCTTPASGASGTITCSAPTLTAGSSATFTVVLNVIGTATGSISNTATVSSTTADSNLANNTSTSTASVATSADVAVNKTGPATANAGTNISYTIAVVNNGPSAAANVSLTDTLPPGETFVSMTQNSGPAFNCSGTSTQTCTIASLSAGATATFTLTVTVTGGTSVSNTANVTSSTPDPTPANNSSTATTTVIPTADLAITKTGTATTAVPGTVSYTITATNNGPSDATNVTITDTLPLNTTFVSMTQNSGPAFNCSGTATVTCTAATFASGASAAFTLTVTVNSGPAFTNTATISSQTADLNTANNTATATTQVTSGTNVPALSPLALALLGLMLAAAGMVAVKR